MIVGANRPSITLSSNSRYGYEKPISHQLLPLFQFFPYRVWQVPVGIKQHHFRFTADVVRGRQHFPLGTLKSYGISMCHFSLRCVVGTLNSIDSPGRITANELTSNS